jgi:hypothetical protein
VDVVASIAFRARVTGWPAWAVLDQAGGCEAGSGGWDAGGGAVVLTCATDPDPLAAGTLGTLSYRAPQPVHPSALTVELVHADAALVERTGAAQVVVGP